MEDQQSEFNARNPWLTQLPRDVSIETVFGCNLRCRMCIMKDLGKFGGGRRTKFMEPAVYSTIIGQVSDTPRSICLNQNGEPLLHPRIVDFVQEAKEHGHFVYLVTNGTRLDENLARDLIQVGLDRIIFSIDGIRKEVYEKIRIGADFDVVLANALRFIELAKASPRGIRVEVHCILSDLTQPDRDEIEQFWKNKAHLTFLPFDDWGGQFDGGEDDFGRPRTQKDAATKRYPCDYLWTTLNISAEGQVLYCCHDYQQSSKLPAVQEQKLLEIWRGRVAREREKHVNGTIDSLPCSRCDSWMTRPEPRQTKASRFTGRLYRFARRLVSNG